MIVSVIIPAYKAESTITTAIHSCLAQTLTDLEIIVIDDASPDRTTELVKVVAASDPRIKLITLSENHGVAHARNAGIRAAAGDWIALLDADDTYAPERLERLVGAATSKGADLVADNLRVAFNDGRLPSRLAFPEQRMQQSDAVTAAQLAASDRPRWGMPAAGFMKPLIRRQFLIDNDIRYVEEVKLVEDFHLYMHCLLRGGKLYYVPEAYYNYTVDEKSLSRGDSAKVHQRLRTSSEQLCRDAENSGDTDALIELRRRDRDLTRWLAFKTLEVALRQKHYRDAMAAFLRLPSKTYAFIRLIGLCRYLLAQRFGIALEVQDGRSNRVLGQLKQRLFRA